MNKNTAPENTAQEAVKLDVRVYPIEEPKGSALAFASVAVDDLAAIRGVRVVEGDKGLFVAMPQSQDNTGLYHDVAFPLNGDLRKEINAAVIEEFKHQASLHPNERGYDRPEQEAGSVRNAADVNIDVNIYPIKEPRDKTLAFASVALDDTIAIRGIRVMGSERGNFVTLPQSKDKNDEYHDIAFPLSGGLRKAISKAVLAEYKQAVAEQKQSIGSKLAEGKEQAQQAEQKAAVPQKAAAKRSPGIGD